MKNLRQQIEAMTLKQRRTRLAEILRLAESGDFSWSYDESVILCQLIPEEAEADRILLAH